MRYGYQKPDIAAPGQGVVSTLSSFATANNNRKVMGQLHYINQGTSMASPTVAGAVALMLQQNGSLSSAQIKTLLGNNAQIDCYTGAVPNYTWGAGKLDVFAAMVENINSSLTADREVIAYDNWNNNTSYTINGSQTIALKFSPTFSGKLSEVFFHVGTASPSLLGNIAFAVYDDNSGIPGTQIGANFYFDDDLISKNTWHSVLNNAVIYLNPTNNYYLVISLANTSDSWSLFTENDLVDNRSLIYNGSSWVSQNFDFRIRPVNSFSDGLSLLPVCFSYFDVQWQNISNREQQLEIGLKNVLLTWQTSSEENNNHFEIERSFDGCYFESIGRVEGKGTTFQTTNYEYVDDFDETQIVQNLGLSGSLAKHIYYRIKQVDFNGFFGFTPIKALTLENKTQSQFNFWPNPNHEGELFFNQIGNYEVFNAQGILIATHFQTNKVDISTLAKGTYFIRNSVGVCLVFIRL